MRDRIRRIFHAAAKPLRALWGWAKKPRKSGHRQDRWQALANWANQKRKLARPKSVSRREWRKRRDTYQRKADFLEKRRDPKPAPSGVGAFDGKPVAAWWVPILRKARDSGLWRGSLTSGFRSPEYSEELCEDICGQPTCPGRCAGRTSNHTRLDEYAAVDVSDPDGFAEALRAQGRPEHNALGAADPWHFSRTGR